jgi:spectrin alpha
LYQAFITDFLATQNEFAPLEKLADELVNKNIPQQSSEIKRKQNDLSCEWTKLLELKKYWDNSIKAIQCIDQFNTMCADVTDLFKEKLDALENDDVCDVSDVKTVRALQSKQDKLERDIGPIETNVNDLKRIADQVCKYFPQEKKNVLHKLENIEDQWYKLRQDVKNRKAKLDEKHGLQRFENEVHDFHIACANLNSNLNELDSPRDLKQCEEMQQKFSELVTAYNNDIIFKFNDLKQLSQQQLAKRGVIGSVEKINSNLSRVAEEKANIGESIGEKRKYLDEFQKYLKFKQDANALELLMQEQEAYLQYEDTGGKAAMINTSADGLLMRHDEFMAKLFAQDEKMKTLAEQMAKLNACKDVKPIFDDLHEKRQKLKLHAHQRKAKLAQAKELSEFKIQCEDLNSWIVERLHAMPNNFTPDQIEKNLNKHEALDKEINSNRTRLEKLKVDGAKLMASDECRQLVSSIESKWLNLENEIKFRGKKLEQTKHKAELNASLADVDSRFKNLEHELNTEYNANDLRSAKQALKKHNDLKKQMTIEADLISDMTRVDEAKKLHSKMPSNDPNKLALQSAIKEYMIKFQMLNPLLEKKQVELETSLNVQQLLFDTDEELKWIEQSEQQIKVITAVMPQTLFDATIVNKKLTELDRLILNNHKPIVEKLLAQSENLKAPKSDTEVKNKAKSLNENWLKLKELCDAKKNLISQTLIEQQDLDQLNQILLSINEKKTLIQNAAIATTARDTSVISKHLAKLDQLEHDLKAFKVNKNFII